ncbi:hypothetical protein QOT17_004762 [Balamuthia mandrillaris]
MRHKRLPLQWENALEGVSEELYDEVEPCSFPSLQLRFRNDRFLGGNNRNDDDNISDEKLVRYFGGWEVCDASDRRLDGGNHKFLALATTMRILAMTEAFSLGRYEPPMERFISLWMEWTLGKVLAKQPHEKLLTVAHLPLWSEFYNPRFTAAYFDMELPKPEEGMPLELGNAAIPLFHVRGENGAGKGFRGQL